MQSLLKICHAHDCSIYYDTGVSRLVATRRQPAGDPQRLRLQDPDGHHPRRRRQMLPPNAHLRQNQDLRPGQYDTLFMYTYF